MLSEFQLPVNTVAGRSEVVSLLEPARAAAEAAGVGNTELGSAESGRNSY